MEKILPLKFFDQRTLAVARGLLGQKLVRNVPPSRGASAGKRGQTIALTIAEVEAYDGPNDRASHASRGRTPRTAVMFGEPGHVYVYLIYGFHYCMNLVSHPPGSSGAVMLRSLEPLEGIELMKRNRGKEDVCDLCSGPGKLTKAMQIDKSLYGEDLLGSRVYLLDDGTEPGEVVARPRIGIKVATQMLWRFYPLRYRQWVSRP